MKKLNYFLLGLAGLAMASCSQDDMLNGPATEGNVHFTISLPSMGTRATELGTGFQANVLQMAVYEDNGDGELGPFVMAPTGEFSTEGNENDLKTTVGMNLVSGKSYYVVFFAQSQSAVHQDVYNFDTENKQLVVDYSKMTSVGNVANAYECFYQIYQTQTISSSNNSFDVTLYRPVAQVNWGTNDASNNELYPEIINTFGLNGQYITTNASLSNVPNTMNFLDKTTSIEAGTTGYDGDVNLNAFAAPYEATFPVGTNEYTYVAMQYVLAPQTSAVSNMTLTITNSLNTNTQVTNDVVVTEAPIQANYRTNIYGSLLSDNVTFNVEKEPIFGGAFDVPQGDPVNDEGGLYYDSATKTYTITTAAGLLAYADIANNQKPQDGGALSQYTILLGNDIDLSSVQYTPFDNRGATFDGQGHTISNMTVSTSGEGNYAGFMSNTMGTVKNLNFKGCNVTGPESSGVVGGYGISSHFANITVLDSKVTVIPFASNPGKNNSGYDGGNKAGAIVGYFTGQTGGSMTNCIVSGCTITGYRQIGGLTGYAGDNVTLTNNTVEKTTIISDWSNNYNDFTSTSQAFAGELIGQAVENQYTESNNTTSQVNVIFQTSKTSYLADSFASLQYIMSQGSSVLSKKTVTLDAGSTDGVWDLGGATIAPLPGWVNGDATLTIEGNNVTIKNVKIAGSSYVGLFGSFSGTIRNLTLEDITVTPTGYTYHCGVLAGNTAINTIENVTIKNAVVDCSQYGNWVGAMIGAMDNPNPKINNVKLEGCNVNSWYAVGGMAGVFNGTGTAQFTGCSITGCTLTGNKYAGIIFGAFNSSTGKATYNNCTISNSTVNGVEASLPESN